MMPAAAKPPLALSISSRFALARILIVAVSTLLVAYLISSGLSNLAADTQATAITSLGIKQPRALTRMAEAALEPPTGDAERPNAAAGDTSTTAKSDREISETRVNQARRIGRLSLEMEPLSARTLRVIGEAADRLGEIAAAEQLMQAAVRLSFRDFRANVWLANLEIGRGDYAQALSRIDAIVRTAHQGKAAALPALVEMAITPDASQALASLLVTNPSWRAWFLGAVPRSARDPRALTEFYLALMASKNPPTNAELKPYLDKLITQNLIEQAYYLWLRTMPEESLFQIGYLYNGDFDKGPTNLPFDWVINPIAGATVRIAPLPGRASERSLQIDFVQKRVPFRHVSKLVLLPPGRFRFAGQYRAIELVNRRGMTWRLYCAENGNLLGETERVSGSTVDWKTIEMTFDVPETGCRAQRLQLELAARVEIEQEVSGSIWFDNLQVTKVEAGAVTGSAESGARLPIPPAATPLQPRALRR